MGSLKRLDDWKYEKLNKIWLILFGLDSRSHQAYMRPVCSVISYNRPLRRKIESQVMDVTPDKNDSLLSEAIFTIMYSYK